MSGFLWNAQCQSAFDTLRQKLITLPISAYADFKIPFTVSTDASATAIGAILSQAQDGTERVLAYCSCQLQKAERNYSTIEREALAIDTTVKEFYP